MRDMDGHLPAIKRAIRTGRPETFPVQIDGCDHLYLITSTGRVYGVRSKKWLRISLIKGQCTITLQKIWKGKRTTTTRTIRSLMRGAGFKAIPERAIRGANGISLPKE